MSTLASPAVSKLLDRLFAAADQNDPAGFERARDAALELAAQAGIKGKAVTPFLLAQMERLTGGRTLAANQALLINNAKAAARIAAALTAA